ncbi:acyl-CoA dehydrogenase family protein [Tenggerimyces flavus]|uniref:Acyl-CoA dehydrogenase family protein n=1 Tax=Tenggerimyces flavus TaxID=1708749 RepID=A0ABV7YMX0_9ACTN|nr:acyl-CoA dehydrogenase family protein [Tenggerimyces flavus]MBM7786285.1 alkylation response protein AidB-like acyl-CoA dehydrogenase [Tenggerimyces flavus]
MSQTAHVTEAEARAVAEAAREKAWAKPSFAKELYLGRLRLDLVHPHPASPADKQAKGQEFLRKLRAYCETLDGQVIERDAKIPDEYVKGFAELGTFGMKIPESYGGLGLAMIDYARALMLIGSVHPSLAALFSAHQSIGVPEPVKLFGTDEQKQAFLPRCASGAISAFLLTEPDVGSDPARLRMSAVPSEDGSEYVLDGVKLWTTNGVVAELLVVMARVPASEGHRGGVSAFVVEADSPGITVENRNAFLGLRGIENGVTRFHQVRVPAANRLDQEGRGLKIALTTLNAGRLSIPATCAAGAKWCLKIAREWAATREQWGRPVGKHAAVANKIAYIAATSYALEAMLELSAEMSDQGDLDIRLEAAIAKLYASEHAWLVADELVQIRGGRGYETADSLAARGERAIPAEQILRDLRINRIFEGSTEIMHLFIAREAVDAHLQAAGELADPKAELSVKAKAAAKASGFYAKWLPHLVAGKGQVPTSYAEFGVLAKHLRFIERASRKLARNTFYGMARWQGKLEFRQGFLARVVDIGSELFVMTAAIVHAHRDRAKDPSGQLLALAFCEQARVRVEELFDRLWRNSDDTDYALARSVLDGKFTSLEEGVLHLYPEAPWISSWASGPSEKENLARRML